MKSFRVSHNLSSRPPDYLLLASIFLIVMFGLAILASASSEIGKLRFDDSYYYLKHQLLYGLIPGIVAFLFAYFIPYRSYRKLALAALLGNLFLLVLIFTDLGVEANGATRWLALGLLIFQPAEFLKISFILYLAAWFSGPSVSRERNVLEGLLPFIIVSALTAGLLLAQPATSTVVILLSAAMAIYFMAGAAWKHIAAFALAGAMVIGLVIMFTPYRLARVSNFFSSNKDNQGANYHLNQALIALGSGGWFGLGYGQSPSKAGGLPEAMDDSVFAVVGQELGFAGAGALLSFFAILNLRIFWLAYRTRDGFARLTLIGFGTIISFQTLVNVGAISGVLPLTGVPLPFVSYGGTAMAVFLAISGISVNISRYN